MDLVNTNRGIIRFVEGYVVTIAHRRGGTSKAIVNRKFTVGQVVCFTVDPVHLNITNVMLKSEADNIVRKSGSEEHQVAGMEDMPLTELDNPEFLDTDPVEQFFGKEEEDDYDNFISAGQISSEPTNLNDREDRELVDEGSDYFGE